MARFSRREFNKTVTTGMFGVAMAGTGAVSLGSILEKSSGDKKPNFIFVCADQHSAKYTGFAGHPLVKTPNLDRIARTGVTFSSAYCGSPLCVPGRSSLMTGMYASDVNSFCNSTVCDGSHPTWGKRLRDNGYYCWAVGKQDMNPSIDMGFVEAGVEHGHVRKPDITSLFRRPVGYRIAEREGIDGRIREEGQGNLPAGGPGEGPERDGRETERALRFLREETPGLGKPWLAFVGLRRPHPPWITSKKYFDEYLPNVHVPRVTLEELEQLPLPYQVMRNFKRISTPIPEEKIRRAVAAYFGMVTELDDHVGQLYRWLEESRQLDNTYFIYTSDHGESLGEHGMWLKNNLYEGDLKIPLLLSGPGIPKGRIVDTPVSHVDLVATMLQLSGHVVLKELRGTSLMPLVNGKSGGGPQFVYSESHSEGNPTGSFMVRKGNWKLIHFSYYSDYLFNLKEDPEEKRNRIDDPAVQGVVQNLRSILRSQVDPEEVTERAFAAQERILSGFGKKMNEEELFNLFRSRLGDGQARVMAKTVKERYR